MNTGHSQQLPTWPQSAEVLRSTQHCPYCFSALNGLVRCVVCGMDLTNSELSTVHQHSVRIAGLLEERASILRSVMGQSQVHLAAATAAQEPVAAPSTPAPVMPVETGASYPVSVPKETPHAESQQRAPRSALTTPLLLLSVGVTFLAIAALVFLTVAFSAFTLTTKAIIVGGITVATLVAAGMLNWRQLRVAAEAIAVFGAILLLLDAWAVRTLNFFGMSDIDMGLYLGSAMLAITLVCALWGWAAHLRVPRLMASVLLVPGLSLFADVVIHDHLGWAAGEPAVVAGVLAITALLGMVTVSSERPLPMVPAWMEFAVMMVIGYLVGAFAMVMAFLQHGDIGWIWMALGTYAIVGALFLQGWVVNHAEHLRPIRLFQYGIAAMAALSWIAATTLVWKALRFTLPWANETLLLSLTAVVAAAILLLVAKRYAQLAATIAVSVDVVVVCTLFLVGTHRPLYPVFPVDLICIALLAGTVALVAQVHGTPGAYRATGASAVNGATGALGSNGLTETQEQNLQLITCRIASAATPVLVWAALSAIPLNGFKQPAVPWWSLTVATAVAGVYAGWCCIKRAQQGTTHRITDASVAALLPVASALVVPHHSPWDAVALFIAATCVLLLTFTTPAQWNREGQRLIRGFAVATAVLVSFSFRGLLPVYLSSLVTVPVTLLMLAVAFSLYRQRVVIARESAAHYAILSPLVLILGLPAGDRLIEAPALVWWSGGFALLLAGIDCGVMMWYSARNIRLSAGGGSTSVSTADVFHVNDARNVIISAHLAAAFASVIFADQRGSLAMDTRISAFIYSQINAGDFIVTFAVALMIGVCLGLMVWRVFTQVNTVKFGYCVVYGVASLFALLAPLLLSLYMMEMPAVGMCALLIVVNAIAVAPVVLSVLPPAVRVGNPLVVRQAYVAAMVLGIYPLLLVPITIVVAFSKDVNWPTEAYTAALGFAWLVMGGVLLKAERSRSSWELFSPTLVLLLLIPLVNEVWNPAGLRIALLTVGIVLAIVCGVVLRLQAPLVVGSIAAIVHAVLAMHYALPDLVVPWWVWLSLAGITLVVMGTTYEARLRDAQRIGTLLRQMR